ncbi:pilus assembly protein [Phenylobacterium sp. J426]|uniref:TadE/TadG family type IV pilus assembly protein n=1 Tax=Phenylobacterium sp. J426 TaxID=2898439 RepID=UPI002151153D|nr:TadE/TadG family type IV pilus assembly protein [Phenylobacterium sp. J426]MCR5876279.1 pilus assembly protein [Phenylobacterium sp. J426]
MWPDVRRRLARFRRHEGGVAALEFALILPILVLLLVVGVDVWLLARQQAVMQSAAHAGARYYQAGGGDLDLARETARQAWRPQPSGARIDAALGCRCGDAAAPCEQLCPTGSPPAAEIRFTASSAFNGAVLQRALTAEETVRVR